MVRAVVLRKDYATMNEFLFAYRASFSSCRSSPSESSDDDSVSLPVFTSASVTKKKPVVAIPTTKQKQKQISAPEQQPIKPIDNLVSELSVSSLGQQTTLSGALSLVQDIPHRLTNVKADQVVALLQSPVADPYQSLEHKL